MSNRLHVHNGRENWKCVRQSRENTDDTARNAKKSKMTENDISSFRLQQQ